MGYKFGEEWQYNDKNQRTDWPWGSWRADHSSPEPWSFSYLHQGSFVGFNAKPPLQINEDSDQADLRVQAPIDDSRDI